MSRSSRSSLEGLIPDDILQRAGKKAHGTSTWLDQKRMCSGVDDDWATPLTFIKLVSYGEARGTHLGLWYGTGSSDPVSSVYSGSDYGSGIRPLCIPTGDLCRRIGTVGSPRHIKPLFATSAWKEKCRDLIPDVSGSDPEIEFCKTPIFTARVAFGGLMDTHARLLEPLSQGRAQSVIPRIFASVDELNDASRWMELSSAFRKEGDFERSLRFLETAAVVNYANVSGPRGYPEAVFLQRDFLCGTISSVMGHYPEWMRSLVAVKADNLRRLAGDVFAKLKKDFPDRYLELIHKGFSAQM